MVALYKSAGNKLYLCANPSQWSRVYVVKTAYRLFERYMFLAGWLGTIALLALLWSVVRPVH